MRVALALLLVLATFASGAVAQPAQPVNLSFATLDTDGVGALMRIAAEKGREKNAKLKLGICGEHGGDPRSIAFCHSLGLNYVSCSPYRVPVARLSAAQAALAAAPAKLARKSAAKPSRKPARKQSARRA